MKRVTEMRREMEMKERRKKREEDVNFISKICNPCIFYRVDFLEIILICRSVMMRICVVGRQFAIIMCKMVLDHLCWCCVYGRSRNSVRDDRSVCHILDHRRRCCFKKTGLGAIHSTTGACAENVLSVCVPMWTYFNCGAARYLISAMIIRIARRSCRNHCRSRRLRRLAREPPWTRAPSDMTPAEGTTKSHRHKSEQPRLSLELG